MAVTAAQVQPPLPADPLPERAAAIGLLVPVFLFLALPIWTGTDASSGPLVLTDGHLFSALSLQLLISATLGTWLWRRGWRPQRTATRPLVWLDVLRGLGLWLVLILAVMLWALVCRALLPNVFIAANQTQIVGRLSLWLVVPYVLFNAVFEELLWLGLAFIAFRRFGVGAAAAVSVGLRLMVHAYQGPLALITILPIGVLITVYYLRTQRLWPIVIAHAFQDLLALGLLALGVSSRAPI